MKFNDISVDLETLGKTPGHVILSIGAVFFDHKTGELGPHFYTVISKSSSIGYGLKVDPGTVDWWSKQSAQAQEVLTEATDPNALSLPLALAYFTKWIKDNCNHERVKVWGNGSDFDNSFLQVAYEHAKLSVPWAFWHNRCMRTVKDSTTFGYYDVLSPVREGVHHNALDDAVHQARVIMAHRAQQEEMACLWATNQKRLANAMAAIPHIATPHSGDMDAVATAEAEAMWGQGIAQAEGLLIPANPTIPAAKLNAPEPWPFPAKRFGSGDMAKRPDPAAGGQKPDGYDPVG